MKNKRIKKIKKILIVGGTGFLGFHLAEFFIKKKFKVLSLSRSKPKKNRTIPNVKYLISDISNKKILKRKLSKVVNLDYVVNLGGEVSHKNFRKTYLSHYVGVKNLSEIFLKKKIKKFIQIGSSMEYGHNKSPQIEGKNNLPKSNYGKAKYLATKHLINFNTNYKFPVIILRLYQVYGPRQDPNRLISFVIKNCLKNKKFPCSNGKQSRDFLYVSDFVKAVDKSLKSSDTVQGQIINIGFGKPYNLKKIINLIRDEVQEGNPEFGKIKLRQEENLVTFPSIKKARKVLNWKPVTKFKKGIIKTIKYYKKAI